MPALLPLAALLLAAAPAAPPVVERALREAVALPGARLELVSFTPHGACEAQEAEVAQPISASGTVAVRLLGRSPGGRPCAGAGFAQVRLFGPAWIAVRTLAVGQPLEGAAQQADRELRAGHPPAAAIPPGAVAARPIPAGAVVEEGHLLDPAWAPGASVRVVVRAGAVALAQEGRLVPCAAGRACAILPSGRRVEGRRAEGELLLEEK